MKKFYVALFTILLMLSLSGCLFRTNAPAPPIQLPNEINTITIEGRALSDAERLSVLEFLSSAEPTTRQSVNDTPYADEYYKIQVIGNESNSVVYLYKSERVFGLVSTWYLEQPYYGIYKLPEASAKQLLVMYHS